MTLKTQDDHAKFAREAFLDEVTVLLRGRLTPLESFECTQEMREHLDAMAAAYQEFGLDPAEAMAAALAKFGSPEKIGEAVAGTALPTIPIGTVSAFVLTLAGQAALGIALMTVADMVFVTLYQYRQNIGLDWMLGSCAGAAIGLLAWFTRLKPSLFGGLLALGLNLFLFCTLYQTYIGLGKAYVNIAMELLLTPAIFILGVTGVRLSRYLKKSLAGRVHKPGRPAIG